MNRNAGTDAVKKHSVRLSRLCRKPFNPLLFGTAESGDFDNGGAAPFDIRIWPTPMCFDAGEHSRLKAAMQAALGENDATVKPENLSWG